MPAAPVAAPEATATAHPAPEDRLAGYEAPFLFTGTGAEYFRIWVVNLLLSLVTLGVYSAWAKVRKTRYFWQNTRLAGHAFDYHGRPAAILRGRILALLLFLAYSWSFEFSLNAGFATIVVLCVLAPWLLLKSAQFRLRNTSHRGLRFGFDATLADAYRVALPPLVLWLGTVGAGATIAYRQSAGVFAALIILPLLLSVLMPWIHARLKWFVHAHASYGDRMFRFEPAGKAFYKTYLKAAALAIVLGIGAFAIGTVFMSLMTIARVHETIIQLVAVGLAALTYALVLPYMSVRLQQIVWEHTQVDATDGQPVVHFGTTIRAWPLLRLVFVNVCLTLVTIGLYWPFAAVRFARYRIECMRMSSIAGIDAVTRARLTPGTSAVGDAVGDTFGFDIGL
ncbi:MAG: DUF898 domain-containing protein [Proteobacteria bacterium]|nr:DUF898 domain-containing protein [Pseudomonadota bacterium]